MGLKMERFNNITVSLEMAVVVERMELVEESEPWLAMNE